MTKDHANSGTPDGHVQWRAGHAIDAKSVEQIFREHNHSLLRFLSARLASEQDAREVAQEAYVRMLQLDKPEGVSFLKAFLFKTAANLAIDRVRHGRFRSRREHCLNELDVVVSVESTVATAQDAELTLEALLDLPKHYRTAFLLSRLDGLSSLEIAERLGVTDRAVRKYLTRTLLHLRARLNAANKPEVADE